MDVWQNLRHQFTIRQTRSCDASSSHTTWQNLSAPSPIEQTGINDNDSHPSVSFEPLIEYEEPNPTTTPKFAYLYACSLTENVFFRCFEQSNC